MNKSMDITGRPGVPWPRQPSFLTQLPLPEHQNAINALFTVSNAVFGFKQLNNKYIFSQDESTTYLHSPYYSRGAMPTTVIFWFMFWLVHIYLHFHHHENENN